MYICKNYKKTEIMKANVEELKVGTKTGKFQVTEKNHPFKHHIIGKPKEQLLNRRPYVLGAIYAWKNNIYNSTPDRAAYNVNYFEVELRIIDKELARFDANNEDKQE